MFTHKKYLTAALLMMLVWCGVQCNEKAMVKVRTDFAALTDNNVQYAGMQTCRECHQSIYDSFIQTGMGKSFEHASKKKSSANFDSAIIYDKYKNFYYQARWKGDSLQFVEFRLWKGDTIHKRVETVHYIVGSGQHTNSHITVSNGFFTQAPMTFYTQKGKWDLPPGFENGHNTRFARTIGLECITCHNSYPEMVPGSDNAYNAVPEGISCERCHGPGSVHVAEKKANILVDISQHIDYSIVNPAKLSIEKQFDICQRCHIQGNAVLRKGKSFFDFIPGMQLSQVMNVFMPVYTNSSEHIMASHAERLKSSKCYLATTQKIENDTTLKHALRPYKNALTCVTCHNPHVSVRQTDVSHFNNTCIGCHTASTTVCAASTKALAAASNNCVSCHMPTSGATDIPHVRVTEHYIRKPLTAAEKSAAKNFVTIQCVNNVAAEPAERGRAYIAYYEKFDLGKFALDSAKKFFDRNDVNKIRQNFDELVHIAYLEQNGDDINQYLQAVPDALARLNKTSWDNADAWTCYRIGEMLNNQQPARAEVFLKRATELAPKHVNFLNKYGNVLMSLNKLNEAKEIFAKAVALQTKNVVALSNLGFVTLVTEQNADKAIAFYDMAIALDPDYEKAVVNKAGALLYKGLKNDAIALLTRYMALHTFAPESKAALIKIKMAS